jgi:hypothetical protein
MKATLEERIDRLESIEEIRQLVAKYCLALDVRDLDALVGLFPEDVRVGGGRRGRRALREWFDDTLRTQFTGTAHVTGNHLIELEDADHARGVVYSRNEHETGDAWICMTMMYWDRYERVNGRWLFRRRLPLYWYACDWNERPTGPHKMRWPDRPPYDGGLPDFWPSWAEFWSRDGDPGTDVAAPAPLGAFLTGLRPSGDDFSVRVR